MCLTAYIANNQIVFQKIGVENVATPSLYLYLANTCFCQYCYCTRDGLSDDAFCLKFLDLLEGKRWRIGEYMYCIM